VGTRYLFSSLSLALSLSLSLFCYCYVFFHEACLQRHVSKTHVLHMTRKVPESTPRSIPMPHDRSTEAGTLT